MAKDMCEFQFSQSLNNFNSFSLNSVVGDAIIDLSQ